MNTEMDMNIAHKAIPETYNSHVGKFAKIIATLGPATSSFEKIEKLYLEGADVFRLNFSHGTLDDHRARLDIIRQVERKHESSIGVLADLQGPKIRVGVFHDQQASLIAGDKFCFVNEDSLGDENKVHLPHPEIFLSVQKGDTLLIDDGKLQFRVTDVTSDTIETEVLVSGTIRDRKGVNLTTRNLKIEALTNKDLADIEFIKTLDIDYIALSFVQSANDIKDLRTLIGSNVKIISKIEKPSAIENIDAIIEASDAVMVARGDLGVEIKYSLVPSLQKRIIAKCRTMGRPVIVATQALESMISSPIPTRAETSDVATSIYDGADAVMLSAETASGKYPVEAVLTMRDIIEQTEADPNYWSGLGHEDYVGPNTDPDMIASAACYIARKRECKSIVTFTESGATAYRVSRHRSPVPILAITRRDLPARQLCLAWGVSSLVTKDGSETEANLSGQSSSFVLGKGTLHEGDRYVITSGTNYGKVGGTDHLRMVEAS